MPSSLRRATVIMILLGVLLVPGLLQARTPARDWVRVSGPAESGFFSLVWNLLANTFEDRVARRPSGSGFAKTGGQLDPAGEPEPESNSTTTSGDTGGQLDPAGGQ